MTIYAPILTPTGREMAVLEVKHKVCRLKIILKVKFCCLSVLSAKEFQAAVK